MQIVDYKYIAGTDRFPGYIAITELDRYKPAALQFIKLADLNIELTRPTAFLYIDGFSISPSDCGLNSSDIDNYMPALKAGSAYSAHEWIHTFKNKEHLVKVDIMSGTCAAGIQALYEAKCLLDLQKVEEVIIIGGERITADTIRLFHELRIPVTCGDGFVYMKLERSIPGIDITDIKWKYAFNRNPFAFTRETLDTLKPEYWKIIDYVKLHGTGTLSNETAEAGLAELGKPLKYKDQIGHTQGVSALLETCIVLDDPDIMGKILVTANGVGGFYGAFTLIK